MDQIKIGWAKREISHEGPVYMPGQVYMRLSEGILDPLYATALALDGGEGQDKVILLSCDIIAVRFCHEVEEMARQKCPEIPENAVVMNVTHTHTSMRLDKTPEEDMEGVEIYPGAKTKVFFLEQASDAVVEAWQNRKPGGIAYGYGFAVVGHSRRVCYFEDMSKVYPNRVAPNGTSVMYGSTKSPLFSHYEAGADHFLNALFTFDGEDKLTGMVLNVPCPSQTSEQLTVLSADYWGDVRNMVAETFGQDVFVLPQCGAAGDTAPRILHYRQAQERRMRLKYPEHAYDRMKCKPGTPDYLHKTLAERLDMAERIVKGAKDVYSWAKKDIRKEVPVRHISEVIPLKRRKITPEEAQWCRENVENMKAAVPSPDDPNYHVALTSYNSVKNRNARAIETFETQGDDPRLNMRVHVVALGEIAMCTNRFELYQDYMHRIQARSPFLQTFVVQLAGDNFASYLPTKRGEEGKGYSASIFCNRVGSEGGQQLVEETLRMLNEAKGE